MNNFPIKCDHLRLSITVITKPTLHIFSLTSAQPKASSFQSIPPKFQFLLHSNLRFINQHNIICEHHTPRFDLTGTDYTEAAIALARSLADRDGFSSIKFLVDDILETKLDWKFQLVTDKGTLDAIGLHPDGPLKSLPSCDKCR
ncbi:hypothetical protein OROGR_007990 [Orobanche gracilis]